MALEDVVVLDLSHALAGPFASTMLADYGATVIKIEPPEGEMARAWGPPFYEGEAAYFVNLNRNKKSIAIDLKRPEGKAIFFRLLESADVVLENLRVGAVAKNASTTLFGVVLTIAESPLKEGLLFAGTDDGKISISENGGATWRNGCSCSNRMRPSFRR